MGDRIQLHTLLCGILGCPERGDACRAYFSLRPARKSSTPASSTSEAKSAPSTPDNAPYRLLDRYQVTAIYKNPDSDLPHRLAMLPMCAHDRHFTADNLNHDIFNLYY